MRTHRIAACVCLGLGAAAASPAVARVVDTTGVARLGEQVASLRDEVDDLDGEVHGLESDVEDKADLVFILIPCGASCGLWAQNTDRRGWQDSARAGVWNVPTLVVDVSWLVRLSVQ